MQQTRAFNHAATSSHLNDKKRLPIVPHQRPPCKVSQPETKSFPPPRICKLGRYNELTTINQ